MEKQLQENRQNKTFCRYKTARNVIFALLGVAVFFSYWFVPERILLPYVAYLVGGTMLLFGLDSFAHLLLAADARGLRSKILEVIILFVIGIVIMIAGHDDLVVACVIWGVWAIEREGMEIAEKVFGAQNPVVALVNFAESVVLIVLSVSMILHPTLHHAHVHVLILGIEYLLEILFPFLDRAVPYPGKPKRE